MIFLMYFHIVLISNICSSIDSIFRWWSKCISATICRTASRNTLFSSARIIKTINVDRRPISSNADYQEDDLCLSVGDEFQDLVDNSDLSKCLISHRMLHIQVALSTGLPRAGSSLVFVCGATWYGVHVHVALV